MSGSFCGKEDTVAKTKTSAAVKNRYAAKTYDRIGIIVHKGEKATIQAAADKASQSINTYVVQAVNERMERDSATPMEDSRT